jgi:hypothetical protein
LSQFEKLIFHQTGLVELILPDWLKSLMMNASLNEDQFPQLQLNPGLNCYDLKSWYRYVKKVMSIPPSLDDCQIYGVRKVSIFTIIHYRKKIWNHVISLSIIRTLHWYGLLFWSRAIQVRMVVVNSLSPIDTRISCMFACNFSNGPLWQVYSCFFIVSKGWKVLGVISDKYGGCGILSNLLSLIHYTNLFEVCGLTLSIWR